MEALPSTEYEQKKLEAYKASLAATIPQGGHVSPETALIVPDYPFGFTLRCTMRYWIEHKPGHGWRMVSQTTNPKKPGHPWNKPKASTYTTGCVLLALEDSTGHIVRRDLAHWATEAEAWAFLEWAGEQLEPAQRRRVFEIIAQAQARNDRMTEENPEATGSMAARYRTRLAVLLAADAQTNGHEATGGNSHATV